MKQALDLKGAELGAKLKEYKVNAKALKLPDGWDKRNVNDDASGGEKKKSELIHLQMLNNTVGQQTSQHVSFRLKHRPLLIHT